MTYNRAKRKGLSIVSSPIAVVNTNLVNSLRNEVNPYYQSQEHKKWRSAVLRRAGFKCERCGRDDGRLYADHIVEIKDGGSPTELSNGQALCASCHTLKTNVEREKRYGLPEWQK